MDPFLDLPIEPVSFDHLYQKYQASVYRRAVSLLGDPIAAEDVMQNIFIQVYRNLPAYRGGYVRAWLLRITTNACYDELRRRKRQSRYPIFSLDANQAELPQFERLSDGHISAEDEILQNEQKSLIQSCMDELKQEHRAAVQLVDLQEMEYGEAAAKLGVPVGTLKSRLWRGRLRLRELIEHRLGEYVSRTTHRRHAAA